MTSSLSSIPPTTEDQTLEVFGETVILRRDPLGSPLDASVIEEIVPPVWPVPGTATRARTRCPTSSRAPSASGAASRSST